MTAERTDRMTEQEKIDEKYMREALRQAKKSVSAGGDSDRLCDRP